MGTFYQIYSQILKKKLVSKHALYMSQMYYGHLILQKKKKNSIWIIPLIDNSGVIFAFLIINWEKMTEAIFSLIL